MKLTVNRIHNDGESTFGSLHIDGKFECFTLEDEQRDEKVHSETRIPEGTYQVKLRTEGGFHQRYSQKFDFHKGMLHVQDVPNFQFILIHIGNTEDDTAGCLLVGEELGRLNNERAVLSSTGAYKQLYPKVLAALECGEGVAIEYIDLEA